MELIRFADMVEEFGKPFTIEAGVTEGHYEPGGKWVPPTTETIEAIGVFLPFTEDDLRYSDAGTYTTQDRKLFTLTKIKEGTKIEYKGDSYTVQGFKDYSDYADTYIYTARRSSHAD